MANEHERTLFLKPVKVEPGPAAAGDACLILLHPPGPGLGARTPLTRDEHVIGRGPENDIVAERDSVSRRHARLFRSDTEGWCLEDLGSTNGSFVNDIHIQHPAPAAGRRQSAAHRRRDLQVPGRRQRGGAYHEEIYRLAILDGLTGVHNKRYFLEFLERELASSQRHGHLLTLVMVDIDHFKALNDTRGHLAGDHVLRTLSSRIQSRMRREDLLARYGGEEFAAVLNSTDLTAGIRFAEDVRRRIEAAPFEFDGESFTITVSLGVASVANEQGVDPAALIARAHEKLYAAKRAGRNRVVG